jgi:membrane dipeptidase
MTADDLLEQAHALHRRHPVVECHTDIVVDVRRRRAAGEPAPLRDDYLHRLRKGGVRFQLLAVGGDVPKQFDDGAARLWAEEAIAEVREEVAAGSELRVVETAADLEATIAADQIGLVLHLEGLLPLEGDVERVRAFHALGLRSCQLTWNGPNELADGVGVDEPRGLTPLGRAVVTELDTLGILIDVSHLAEPGFWDLAGLVRGPFVASHANAAALHPHRRNLTDDQIAAIAASGGFVGVCFVGDFIAEEPSLELLLDHVDHIAALVGVESLAVGPDYVEFALDVFGGPENTKGYLGPDGLRRVETLPLFTAGLLDRGYSEEDVAKILGGNALRVLKNVLPA